MKNSAPKILLVEDDLLNQKVALRLLEQLGQSAHVAKNGKDALRALGKQTFELVLMDCQMPVMDGFEATLCIRSQIKGKIRDIPIVAMTANTDPENKERCFEVGMNDYMNKPVGLSGIKVMLEKWLQIKIDLPPIKPSKEKPISNVISLDEYRKHQAVVKLKKVS